MDGSSLIDLHSSRNVVPPTAAATSSDSTMALELAEQPPPPSPDSTMASAPLEEETSQLDEPKFATNHEQIAKFTEMFALSEHRHPLELLMRKDKKIEKLSYELRNMENRLEAAVAEKMEALARLDKIESLSYKERKVNSDVERLNSTIDSLTEELKKYEAELSACQQKVITVSHQSEIDMQEISGKLKTANVSIVELSETNEQLKVKNADVVYKLREQCIESAKMKKGFEDELNVKTDLAELHRQNCVDYQNQTEELTNAIHQLQNMLDETIDAYGLLETRLEECALDHQTELHAKDKFVTEMEQELKDANRLLKVYNRGNDRHKNNTGTGDGADIVVDDVDDDLPTVTDHPMTYTKIYSEWQGVARQLQNKDVELKTLETKTARLIDEVRECFMVEKLVGRKELERSRSECERLKSDNDKLKFFGNEYLTKLFSNEQPDETLNFKAVRVTGGKSNISALEQQNESLLCIINKLMKKLLGVNSENTTTLRNLGDSDITCAKSQAENLIVIELLEQDNVKLNNDKQQMIADNNLLLAQRNSYNVQLNFLKDKIDSLYKENEKWLNIIKENSYVNKCLREENANGSMKLSDIQDQLGRLESQYRTMGHMKTSLVVEVETLKEELVREKVANKELAQKVETMKRSVGRTKIEPQRLTDSQGDAVISYETMNRDSGTKKNTFLQPLIKPEPQDSIAECSSRIISSSKASGRKRNTAENISTILCTRKLRPRKKARVEFIDLSEESDEEAIVDVVSVDSSSDLLNIKLQQCLAEVKTRKQAKFVLDAFSYPSTSGDLDEKPKEKNTRRASRSRSTGNVRSAGKDKITRRTRSASNGTANIGRQKSKVTRNLDTGKKVEKPSRKRRHSSKRSRSNSNGRSNDKGGKSTRSRSTICHLQIIDPQQPQQPNARHRKSIVDRQQPTEKSNDNGPYPTNDDCYILQSTMCDSNDYSQHSRVSSLRSRRLRCITDATRQTSNTDHQQSTPIDRQSVTGHRKSNVDRRQPIDGGYYILQTTISVFDSDDDSENAPICKRRSRRLISRFRRLNEVIL